MGNGAWEALELKGFIKQILNFQALTLNAFGFIEAGKVTFFMLSIFVLRIDRG